MERLQKIIANSGFCSRRKAEELILKGLVSVNGQVVNNLGTKASYADVIEINGKTLKKENKEYILLYKPRGVVTTTSDDKNRKTVLDLVETTNRLYPVGRLDYDTSGALILTNDGELTDLLIHPRNKVEKVYVAKLSGIITPIVLKKLCNGVVIDGEKTAPAKAKIKKINIKKQTSLVELTIYEGRNHQVKKMFKQVGYDVLKLKREKFSILDLKGLKPGEYRHLSVKEVKILYAMAKSK